MTPPDGSDQPHRRGGAFGLAAAALFGASAPLSKLLLPHAGPLLLSALLYLGAGLGLSLFKLFLGRSPWVLREAELRRSDLKLLLGIILAGGIAGPVLMLLGLERVSSLTGSLLLNLEAPFTMLLAVLLFREHLGRRAVLAALLILLGAAALSYRPGELHADWLGAAALAGACLSWGIDNNLSQRLSLRDPIAVVHIKTLGAGICTLIIALATGHSLPGPGVTALALLLGSLSYGLSLVFDMQALRLLGAAREAAYFATAPFIGAILSIPLLGDRPMPLDFAAMGLMIVGVVLLRHERHRHVHAHDLMDHDHVHVHDEHHQHPHDGPITEPHVHPHRHQPMTHEHAHVPNLHHRHKHK